MGEIGDNATLQQLRTFAEVASSGRWDAGGALDPRAAKETVKRFYRNVPGQPLVMPGKGIDAHLTSVGRELAERVRRALEELERDTDRLRFLCYPAQLRVAAPLLRSFRDEHGIRVDFVPVSDELRANDARLLRDQLLNRSVDVVILPADIHERGYASAGDLYEWSLCAVFDPARVPRDFDESEPVPLTWLCDQALAAAPAGHRSHHTLTTHAARRRLVPRVVLEHADPDILCVVPAVSAVVAVLPSDAVHHPAEHLTVRPIADESGLLAGTYKIAHVDTGSEAEALARHLIDNWPDA
jgi:DNA-binding transcriptional LysR family regulator